MDLKKNVIEFKRFDWLSLFDAFWYTNLRMFLLRKQSFCYQEAIINIFSFLYRWILYNITIKNTSEYNYVYSLKLYVKSSLARTKIEYRGLALYTKLKFKKSKI